MLDAKHDFTLRVDEAEYLAQLSPEDAPFAGLLAATISERGAIIVRLTREEAEQFREILTIQLAATGFDEDYCLNAKGRMIEDLIDKLHLE